ncbi:baculoviral IAP repeat-containing protein 1-like [Hyperolius riggenbachi]|uniref:baculoviral IAP repeat-containing protein 1-like n=1 Tax=Hyperolius riggenbachi TaxID=752182 RepID=UPI0035A39385
MDLTNISEFESSFKPTLPSFMENIDMGKAVKQEEERYKKIREQLPKGPNYSMKNEVRRLRSLLCLQPSSTWCPKEIAAAGFFYTGLAGSVQCFCCGLVLCKTTLSYAPIERHGHFNPNCEFVKGGESGNISKYEVHPRPVKIGDMDCSESFKDEQLRLQSFSCWPFYALIKPSDLAEAGFFFAGTQDTVQCFSCKGTLGVWEEDDDPWKEHAKWFPGCTFLRSKKSPDEIEQYNKNEIRFDNLMNEPFTSILDPEAASVAQTQGHSQLGGNVERWKKQLIEKYNDSAFCIMSPFRDSVSVDLDSHFADISTVLKDIRNQPVRQLTLPDILSELRDITMIEGELGSGKTALLRKIAILWASGKCPLLSRFSLVFYISLSSTDSKQSLYDMICQQVVGSTTSISEKTLDEIMRQLKEKVLFLLDDYGIVVDSVPEAIDELLLKNPWNRMTIAVTVSTDKSKKMRQCARTIVNIQRFPLYSTIYLVKNIFSDCTEYLKAFVMKLIVSENLRDIFETPLMTLAHCSSNIQSPFFASLDYMSIFMTYLNYSLQKFSSEAETVNSQLSLCGELALIGLFRSQFQFTDIDLRVSGVDSHKAIKFGILSKFTAQRLQSIYRFCDASFQESLAGRRLCELLDSEKQEDLEKGFHYLHQVNTFLKLIGRYSYLLKYAIRNSSRASVKILSFLFSLYDTPGALDCHVESKEHLKQHPELELKEEFFILALRDQSSTRSSSMCMNTLMEFAVDVAVYSQCMPEFCTLIMNFLTGKTLTFSLSSDLKYSEHTLRIIQRFPESISVLKFIMFTMMNSGTPVTASDDSSLEHSIRFLGIPAVESDYSSAYPSPSARTQRSNKIVSDINRFFSLFRPKIEIQDSVVLPFVSLRGHKVPNFKLRAIGINSDSLSPNEYEKLRVIFSISDHIELILTNCTDFIKHLGPIIEQLSASFKVMRLNATNLTTEEQQQILQMSTLECLEITCPTPYQTSYCPELLLRGIHKFPLLAEVSIHLNNPKFLDHLPDEFQQLENLKKIDFICNHYDINPTRFLTALQNFTFLKSLNLNGLMVIVDKSTAENLAVAIGSLTLLEKLWLPIGKGMASAAMLIIQQLQNIPNLQLLSMNSIIDDESIALLGEATKSGYLERMQHLELGNNENITESGWTKFFKTAAGHMPELSYLSIYRMYTKHIKSHPITVTALVRFVSRLPRLVRLAMTGWLLDEEDLNMINTMKEKHPQAQRLNVEWQWYLPLSPTIEN